ncbi:hypothetical protein J2847_006416 [Azospirillum agricola]|uniref:hypothetical protein n=1 Tax=Azospirillum agricola TaxID=1720247 RepID=UPI001F24B378|nr:hypothetical protein [Azospirillum agricola]MBP2233081.1 hypothetical protein [Azospirillum agricola]
MLADLAAEEPEAAALVADRLAELGEAVEPHAWCRWAWRAWHTLSDSRQWRGGGMGPATPSPIPWPVVARYAAHHQHPLPVLLRLLRAMDDVYCAWWAEQAKAAAKRTED